MTLAITAATAVVAPSGFRPTAMDVVVASTADRAGSGS